MNVTWWNRGDGGGGMFPEGTLFERTILAGRMGIEFVAESSEVDAAARAASEAAPVRWPLLDARRYVQPVGCDSCDDVVSQNVECTLDDDEETFYSSRGFAAVSAGAATADVAPGTALLVYRLQQACVLYAVQLTVFRADFHPGRPIYPFQAVDIGVGCSLRGGIALADGSADVPDADEAAAAALAPSYRGQNTSEPQTFGLQPPMVGLYVVLRLRGFPQQQLTDRLHYVALRSVRLFGEPLRCASLARRLRESAAMGFGLDGHAAYALWRASEIQHGEEANASADEKRGAALQGGTDSMSRG
ncbi:hypothetical protein CDCA_CDCA09G2832 [Cyanidium caldarium]|uniref:Uncharacterized protein n=1 Tax=Cyanidium caldarium TaxID=2771 RepID=A0AAV9IWV0_CYACA|nr:hypothetical protein CDCA_CDCA09G2832 [Cyanidium caldarium]